MLFDPNPFLFFEDAVTDSDLPFLIPLIVHDVLRFLIVQDLPPAETLLPVIVDPPLDAGSEIVTVTFTFPFLGADDVTETTEGAEGFVIFDFVSTAWEGLIAKTDRVKVDAQRPVTKRI